MGTVVVRKRLNHLDYFSVSFYLLSPISLLQFLFQQLGVIIAIVKQHIRNYLDDIFELIKVKKITAVESTATNKFLRTSLVYLVMDSKFRI